LETLAAIEEIKALKARYFRFLDCKQWEQWQECFSEDFTALYEGPHPDIEFASREELIAENRRILADVLTVHHGHSPEITLTSTETARGIWAMYDRVELPGAGFEGWGHYHEKYRKIDGQWKISRIHLTRLKISSLQRGPV